MGTFKNVLMIFLSFFIAVSVSAQTKSANQEMTQMLDFSRPDAMHQVLKQLAGTWQFQDSKLAFVKGTLIRTSRYDDRFFDVEITGGKLQLPVATGFKEDNYRSFQLEGYDNVRKLFITVSVNNHSGSDIQEQTGSFDEAKKQLVYEWDSELLPNKKVRNKRIITLIDVNHYTEEFYETRNGTYKKTRQLNYTK